MMTTEYITRERHVFHDFQGRKIEVKSEVCQRGGHGPEPELQRQKKNKEKSALCL